MRPLQISFTAFGPYCEKQTLNFSDLKGVGLFLIHGPTGAGKTTILDAICFALYGETSGEERDGRQMRSDLVDETLFTEVTLDFQVGKETFRVTRSPEQERLKRGGGITKNPHPHKATLWKQTGTEDDDGQIVAASVSDVKRAIAELLGFSSQEFRQVVMLPQGRFREMLTAGSDQRQKILQTLFQTGSYKRIEQMLKDKSKGTRQEMEALRNKEVGILEQAEADSEDDLKQRLKDTKEDLGKANAKAQKLSGKEEKCRQAKDAAEAVQEKLDAVTTAKTAFDELEDLKPDQEKSRKTLEAAEAAEKIDATYRNFMETQKENEEAQADLEAKNEAFVLAGKKQKNARSAITREEGKDKKRSDAARKVMELEAHKKKMGSISSAQEYAEAAENAWNTAKNTLTETQETKDQASGALKALEEQLRLSHEAELSLEGLKAKDDKARSDLKLRARLEALVTEIPVAQEKYETAELKARQRGKHKDDLVRGLREAEDAHWASAASHLAGELKDGEACPVCGSPDHPAPKKLEDVSSAETNLNELRSELDRVAVAHDEAIKEFSEAQKVVENLHDELTGLRETLKKNPQKTLEAFEKNSTDAEKAYKGTQKLAGEKSALSKKTSQAKKALDKAQDSVTTAETEVKNTEKEHTSAQALLKERESEIPKKLRSQEALEEALEEAQAHQADLERALKAAREAAEEANNMHASAKEATSAADKALKRVKGRFSRQKSAFEKALKDKGFKNEESFLSAQLDKETREDLKDAIEQFEESYRDAKTLLQQTTKSAKGLKAPDLETLQAKWEGARDILEEAQAEKIGLQNQQAEIQRAHKGLKALRKEFEALEERYRCEGYLAEVTSGKNERNLSFERFVLATWLDEVLQAANQRFDVMSRGRYLLQREEEVTHGSKAAGLNLAVLDSHTDRPRSVTTLSGGEGFLAALSLALGVVDVVQRYAGGTVIETLFIDEGFGNLDSEALDAAMQALVDLQTDGRLIGVISHVREMQERIDAKLKVTPGKKGNRAQFVVP